MKTRIKILKEAERLFQLKGYNGFSYKDISGPLNIKNAAVHYHFPTKEDLGVAILERYDAMLLRITDNYNPNVNDPVKVIDLYIRFHLHSVAKGDRICPVGMVSAEYQSIPMAMQQKASIMINRILNWLTDVIEQGRNRGLFQFQGEPKTMAYKIQSTLQGAAQLSLLVNPDVLVSCVKEIRIMLNIR